jgi:hypothetical protein
MILHSSFGSVVELVTCTFVNVSEMMERDEKRHSIKHNCYKAALLIRQPMVTTSKSAASDGRRVKLTGF